MLGKEARKIWKFVALMYGSLLIFMIFLFIFLFTMANLHTLYVNFFMTLEILMEYAALVKLAV